MTHQLVTHSMKTMDFNFANIASSASIVTKSSTISLRQHHSLKSASLFDISEQEQVGRIEGRTARPSVGQWESWQCETGERGAALGGWGSSVGGWGSSVGGGRHDEGVGGGGGGESDGRASADPWCHRCVYGRHGDKDPPRHRQVYSTAAAQVSHSQGRVGWEVMGVRGVGVGCGEVGGMGVMGERARGEGG